MYDNMKLVFQGGVCNFREQKQLVYGELTAGVVVSVQKNLKKQLILMMSWTNCMPPPLGGKTFGAGIGTFSHSEREEFLSSCLFFLANF